MKGGGLIPPILLGDWTKRGGRGKNPRAAVLTKSPPPSFSPPPI